MTSNRSRRHWLDRNLGAQHRRQRASATEYVTFAEGAPEAEDYPGALPAMLWLGRWFFRKPPRRVGLQHIDNWWAYVPGADRRSPGRTRDFAAREAGAPRGTRGVRGREACAAWAGKSPPMEADGSTRSLEGAVYSWGDEVAPGGRLLANTWQGQLPWENSCADGYEGTAP